MQVVDYIINAVKSTAPGAELSDEDIDIRDGFSGWEWVVLNICEVWCTFPPALQIKHCKFMVWAGYAKPVALHLRKIHGYRAFRALVLSDECNLQRHSESTSSFLPGIVQIASILALILAWVYIFDTVMKEREKLEAPQEGIVGAVPRDIENQNAPEPAASTNGATSRATGAPLLPMSYTCFPLMSYMYGGA